MRPFVLLGLVVLLLAIAAFWIGFGKFALPPPKDFVEYWSFARVAVTGGNPYDGEELLPLQKPLLASPDQDKAVMMWNPPWSLPLYLPLAWLEPRLAQTLWLVLQVTLIGLSCVLLWDVYEGSWTHLPAAILAAIGFHGTLWNFCYGQNTGFLLLGLAGFTYFEKRNRPVLAGICAALTALKPHLLAVFGVLMILNTCRPGGTRLLLAGVGTLAVSLGLALTVNSGILGQYWQATLHSDPHGATQPLSGWAVPLASWYLRQAIDPSQFWIQFVPCVLACGMYAVYFLAHRRSWSWPRELPGVIWTSVLTAPYGGWLFDLVVLLVPVIQAAVWLTNDGRRTMLLMFAISYFAMTLIAFASAGSIFRYLEEFWWVAPLTALWCMTAWYFSRGGGGRPRGYVQVSQTSARTS